jgi:hypothetical protein
MAFPVNRPESKNCCTRRSVNFSAASRADCNVSVSIMAIHTTSMPRSASGKGSSTPFCTARAPSITHLGHVGDSRVTKRGFEKSRLKALIKGCGVCSRFVSIVSFAPFLFSGCYQVIRTSCMILISRMILTQVRTGMLDFF